MEARATCERMRHYAESLVLHAPLPGGVITIADRTGLITQSSFGLSDRERAIAMTVDCRFEIGSISKVFTSLLVNQLAEHGILSLDDRITDILDWVSVGRGAEPPTIGQLLSHMSGLVMGADSLPDEVAQVWQLRNRAVGSPQGSRFHYSNVGFMMLGLAVSARTGTSLHDLIQSRLLSPMGMTQALAAVTQADRTSLAVGYVPAREDRPWAPGDALAPAAWFEVSSADGNIAATGRDMSRLVMLLLGDGAVDGRRVVSPGVVPRMTRPTASGGEPIEDFPGLPKVDESRYGLGINVERVGDKICLTHGGGMVGYSSFLLVDQTAGFGIVVLTNSNGDNLHAQLLARLAHADLSATIDGGSPIELPPADPVVRLWGTESTWDPTTGLGHFVRAGDHPTGQGLTVEAPAEDGTLVVRVDGKTGSLFRTLTNRHVTDHPQLRRFHLDPVRGASPARWTHGPDVYVLVDEGAKTGRKMDGGGAEEPPTWQAVVGHYRSFSPWFPELRVVSRQGRLLLVAPGGVEAPAEEEELVEVAPGEFRVGIDPWLPERLVIGPVVDGRAITIDRDGCLYSRTSSP
jgi:CubicO group peptidase (beta-lactamase class C family)